MVSLICAKSMFFLLNVFLQHLVLVSVVCVGSSVSGVACGQLWWLRLQIKLRCQVAGTNLFNNKAAVATRCISSVLYRMKLLSLQTCKRRFNQEFRPCHDECSTLGNPKKVFPQVNTLDVVRPICPQISQVMRCKFRVVSITICMMDPRFAP